MLRNKKGDLEIRYLILFALGLVVLVVIVLIIFGGTSDFSKKITGLLADLKPDLSFLKSTKPATPVNP